MRFACYADWCSGRDIGSGGSGFASQAGQFGHSVAKGSPSLRRICVAQLLSLGDGPFRRNTTSILKIWFLLCNTSLFSFNYGWTLKILDCLIFTVFLILIIFLLRTRIILDTRNIAIIFRISLQ